MIKIASLHQINISIFEVDNLTDFYNLKLLMRPLAWESHGHQMNGPSFICYVGFRISTIFVPNGSQEDVYFEIQV